jgi:hypothetical protein
MQISAIISQMAVLFLILAIGYIANRFRIMTAESNSLLTKIVINIAMPCTILSSVMSGEVEMTGNEALFFGLMIALTYIIAFILVIPVPRLLRSPKEDAGLYRFLIVFGNVGFMGFPVAQTIFGSASVFYVALFNIPFPSSPFRRDPDGERKGREDQPKALYQSRFGRLCSCGCHFCPENQNTRGPCGYSVAFGPHYHTGRHADHRLDTGLHSL